MSYIPTIYQVGLLETHQLYLVAALDTTELQETFAQTLRDDAGFSGTQTVEFDRAFTNAANQRIMVYKVGVNTFHALVMGVPGSLSTRYVHRLLDKNEN